MGAVNRVVQHAELEAIGPGLGPEDQRQVTHRAADAEVFLQLLDDGLVGQQLFAGETTRLAYMTDEAQEGRDQFLEKREADWSPFPWYY